MSSENSATQISRAITGLSLYTRESEDTGHSSPCVNQHCSSHTQSSTRNSEELYDNLPGQDIDPHYADGPFISDIGHPRKRFKSNIPELDHHHTEEPSKAAVGHNEVWSAPQNHWNGNLRSAAAGISSKRFGRLEQDLQYEGFSRSPSIFSENRTIAVVIDNRSRSTSTSTSGKKGQDMNNLFQTPTTVKDLQETLAFVSGARYTTTSQKPPPPASYQDSRTIVTSPDEHNEFSSPPKQTRPLIFSEVKNSQEIEEELTDAPMSLDSTEIYSPAQGEHNTNTMSLDNIVSSAWERSEALWRSLEEEGTRPSTDLGVSLTCRGPATPPGQGSPQYPPSVGDPHGKAVNGQHTSQEYRDMSSPPYSPPPPDIPDIAPELVNPPESHIPPSQSIIQDNRQTNVEWFTCKVCKFYIANNGQYKDKLWCEPNF